MYIYICICSYITDFAISTCFCSFFSFQFVQRCTSVLLHMNYLWRALPSERTVSPMQPDSHSSLVHCYSANSRARQNFAKGNSSLFLWAKQIFLGGRQESSRRATALSVAFCLDLNKSRFLVNLGYFKWREGHIDERQSTSFRYASSSVLVVHEWYLVLPFLDSALAAVFLAVRGMPLLLENARLLKRNCSVFSLSLALSLSLEKEE